MLVPIIDGWTVGDLDDVSWRNNAGITSDFNQTNPYEFIHTIIIPYGYLLRTWTRPIFTTGTYMDMGLYIKRTTIARIGVYESSSYSRKLYKL